MIYNPLSPGALAGWLAGWPGAVWRLEWQPVSCQLHADFLTTLSRTHLELSPT